MAIICCYLSRRQATINFQKAACTAACILLYGLKGLLGLLAAYSAE